jgi:hypothetical protein
MQLFLLLLRRTVKVDQESPLYSGDGFSFIANGSFKFSFTEASASRLFVGVCTKSEFLNVKRLEDPGQSLCLARTTLVALSAVIEIVDNLRTFQRIIEDPGVYFPYVFSCDQLFSRYSIELEMRNPDSLLSADFHPSLLIKPIMIGFLGVVMVFWIVNWIRNFTLKNYLHLTLSAVFFVQLLYLLIGFIELRNLTNHDTNPPLTISRLVLSVIDEISIMTFMIICSTGFLIITRELQIRKVILAVIYSTLVVIPLVLIEQLSLSSWDFVFVSLFVFGISLYYSEIVSSINRATLVVLAHLLLISREGIDIRTTPIYSKFRMFTSISWLLMLYFASVCLSLLFTELGRIPYWIRDLVKDFANLIILAVSAFVFRLRKATNEGYQMVGEEQEPVHVNWSELDGLTLDSEQLKAGNVRWEEGMKLPGQPVFIGGIIVGNVVT